MIYYKKNDKIEHEIFVIISENLQHNSHAVNLFNRKMINHLKKKIGDHEIQKITYFSDGLVHSIKIYTI